jgi:hypothetical protein
VTLAGSRLIVADNGRREETMVADGEIERVLEERFGLVL